MKPLRESGRTAAAFGAALGTAALVLTALATQAQPPKKAASFAAPPAAGSALATAEPEFLYNRDIRPILSENCFACHGPDSASRKAGLRLDRFADATAKRDGGGLPAIVPGDPINSELTRRILKPEGDPLQMPPKSSHKSLTASQRRAVLLWIEQGAKYEAHWSYLPPKRPAVPKVKNAAWVRNPIDAFVLARLEKEGLTPAPEADRRTLARRLALDLTGLPPDPKDVETFVADTSPDAYEKLVDKYLASPHWGEHRGRYWLDAARYADTHGIHFDNYREMWSYRDWVVQAFNRNMPFDRFTTEQLAGDLLPKPTLEQRVATGFNRCNITTNEGGAIDEEYRVLYTRDRTETTAQVWLGSTAGCAVCHDHKFDPLSQKEFYSLAAFFNNTTQRPMDGNVKDTPPIVSVPMAADRPRFDALQGELAAARKGMEDRRAAAKPDFEKWRASADAAALAGKPPSSEGLRLHAPLAEGKGREVAVTVDGAETRVSATADPGWDAGAVALKSFQRKGSAAVAIPEAGDFEKDQAFSCAAWVKVGANANGAIVARMDEKSDYRGWDIWMEGGRVGSHVIHKWPEDSLKVVARTPLTAGKWHHVCLTYDGSAKQGGLKVYVDGVAQATEVKEDRLKSTIRTTVPFKVGQRSEGQGVEGASIQDLRLYGRALAPDEVKGLGATARIAYLAGRKEPALTAAESSELFGWWLGETDAPYRARVAKVAALEAEEREIRQRGTIAHVSQEMSEEAKAFILFRGEYDQRREAVTPATPAILPAMPANLPKNRLGLAKWLLLPDHPLTSRVTVNRFWQEIFGQGLVRTSGDFGVSGEMPSHPELLDWMAVEFRAKGWDVKHVVRLIVTSAAYRQQSHLRPELREKDPANRLLASQNPRRLEAEFVRDNALAVSGLLRNDLGGPPVKPYQPDGYYESIQFPDRPYAAERDDRQWRRGVYTHWQRTFLHPMLANFDAPSREDAICTRTQANTPQQALTLLNDPSFVEAARVFAADLVAKKHNDADRLELAFRRALARPPKPAEKASLTAFLAKMRAEYGQRPEDAKKLLAVGYAPPPPADVDSVEMAAWTSVCRVVLNLNETLTRY